MYKTNIHNAKTHFSKYLKMVANGEEVIICSANNPIAKLVPYKPSSKPRIAGEFKGQIKIEKDFDVLPKEFVKFF